MALPYIISFEGLDGSFKETNAKRTVDLLKSEGFNIKEFDFPQYDKPSSYFIREFLAGNYKNLKEPFVISMMYALDRFDVWNKEIKQYYTSDSDVDFIIFDRWTTSNMFYQCARRPELWASILNEIRTDEQSILKLPRENLMLYLDLPYDDAIEVMKKNRGEDKMDENEKNSEYLKMVFKMAPTIIKELGYQGYNIKTIPCADEYGIRARDDIWRDISMTLIKIIKERKKIKENTMK